MATLQDIINQQNRAGALPSTVKVGNQLQQVGQQGLQQAAAAAGQPAPPTSPMAASQLGVNPDVAKMAGTQDQKGLALRESVQSGQDLETQQREAAARTQQTGQEAAEQQKQQSLGKLNSLEGRVDAITRGLIAGGSASNQANATLNLDVNPTNLPPNVDAPTATGLLNRMAAGGDDALQASVQFNQMIGHTQAGTQLTPDQILSEFSTNAQDVVAKKTLEKTASSLTVDKLPLQELGFQSADEVANLLGLDPAKMNQMTIPQMQQEINKQLNSEYNRTAELQTKASDPTLGQAERAEAAKQLKDMGATGVASSEVAFKGLNESMKRDDVVTFNGQKTSVEDLLKSDNITKMVQDYINDPAKAAELQKNEPQLAQFIETNKTELATAVNTLKQSQQQFTDIQQANLDLAKVPNLPNLDKGLLDVVAPGWDQISAKKVDPNSISVIGALRDPNVSDQNKAAFVSNLQTLKSDSPDILKQVSQLSKDQLDKIGATTQSATWKNYVSYTDAASQVERVPNDPAQVYAFVFGKPTSPNEAQALYDQAKNQIASGFPNPAAQQLIDTLDPNHTGQLADPKLVKDTMSDRFGQYNTGGVPKLTDLVNGAQMPADPRVTVQKGANTLGQGTDMYNKEAPYIKDGKIADPAGLANSLSSDLPSLRTILGAGGSNLDTAGRTTLQNKLTEFATTASQKDLQLQMGAPGSAQDFTMHAIATTPAKQEAMLTNLTNLVQKYPETASQYNDLIDKLKYWVGANRPPDDPMYKATMKIYFQYGKNDNDPGQKNNPYMKFYWQSRAKEGNIHAQGGVPSS